MNYHPIKSIVRRIDSFRKRRVYNRRLAPVIAILQKEGASDDQIADAIANIITAVSVVLYSSVIESFSEEDIMSIEACVTDEQADKLIAKLYSAKVGVSPRKVLKGFLKEVVEKFLEEHQPGIKTS